ncbi:hypothetical protein BBF96_12020 [Anoxybacter fermentans]|uniref:GGDEF domain-containing protein n=1 Tax=Anoxybacter fermentans TaxID=1323375 RepID=A0A3Q9HRQ8_9FIRM|nr:GGDEF domain-containing protein [Anoxybacter fermentans]AZR74057.1 hypothetical protein BBF96_12020 [Anoxybacter fermentans]
MKKSNNNLIWKEIEIKLICVGIPAIGLTILLSYLPKINPLADFNIIVFMVINVFADLLSVVLPTGVNLSLSFPFMICVLLLLGSTATMWVYIPGVVVSHILKKKEPFKIIFNVSQISISVYIAGLFLPDNISNIVLTRDILWILLVVVILDFFNFAQVIKIICINRGSKFFKTFYEIWIHEMATVRPIYYATGIIMAICYQAQGIIGALLVAAPVLGAFFLLNAQNELKSQTSRANTDALTELGNRYALANWWKKELSYIINNSKDLSVLMIDIDNFKKFNDTYGHDIGDEILKLVARTIKKCVRQTDCVFRFGGEEFVVLLPDSNIDNAKQVAERIRISISETKIPHLNNVSITISAGLSHLTSLLIEEENDIPDELIRRADKAMYMAKQNGKNQVQVYI